VLVVTPADQTVTDEPAFTAALRRAVRRPPSGAIVILGIQPDRPETGYGYIRADGARWRSSSRSPTPPRPSVPRRRAATSGTPACSC
jgi:mannose-1-phosphate guanylyltransferase